MDIVLCWHMHQPDYRLEGRYFKPWTWLHAIKDYADMAAHLESVAGARAVVNFSPVLIEQLRDYSARIRACLENNEPVGDLLLDALAAEEADTEPELIAQLLRVNEQRMKGRFVPYARLFESAKSGTLSAGQVPDLLVWYVVVWLGESLRDAPLVEQLVGKERGFTPEDRRALLRFIADVIDGILPRYRRLMERGTAELSITPYAHPIVPLLLDFESARDAEPECALPESPYPGGEERCDWHLAQARRVFREAFGTEPAGCWPSEGALSRLTVDLLARHDFKWTASGSQVLHNTLTSAGKPASDISQLRPWRMARDVPVCFFRDDGLSDLIGFEYSKWPADEAADDFVAKLEQRRKAYLADSGSSPVLSIIMDGENAWEYYLENGWRFLQVLYKRLAAHPDFRLTTFSEAAGRLEPLSLPDLCAGSWVHGSLSTWIGDPAKNRAWDLLCGVKRAVSAALEPFGTDDLPSWAHAVLRQLAICEASDWFWWAGGAQPLEDAPQFDALYRRQLAELYRLIGMAPPDILEQPVASEIATATALSDAVVGAMRRSSDVAK